MEVSHKSRTQQELNNALGSAGAGLALGAGINAFRQKGILNDPTKLENIKADVFETENKIKENEIEKGAAGVWGKLKNLYSKRNLLPQKDMLESLPKKEFSYKAMGKYAAFFAVDVAVLSFAIDKVVDVFRGKKD